MPKKSPTPPVPNLAILAAEYDEYNESRLAVQHKLNEIEKIASEKKQLLIAEMQRQGTTATGYDNATFILKEEIEPTVTDWDKVYAHVKKTGEFDLLYRRVNNKAIKERWGQEHEVPGIGSIPVYKLSRSSR